MGSPSRFSEETIEKILNTIAPNGKMRLILEGYESRAEQREMLLNVIEAFNEKQIALIEAGTGVGKSLAYLFPAIVWALQTGERILISTNTINLQEQLLHKDLPLLKKLVDQPIKTALVKGMSNFVCFRKIEENIVDRAVFSEQQLEEFRKIEAWAENAQEGSRSDLPFTASYPVWESVAAEADTCTYKKCHHFDRCHFFKARKRAEDAQILIANHALLFADLYSKRDVEEVIGKGQGILPDYKRVIMDEAHHIEKVATDFFADRVSYVQVVKWLKKLGGEKTGRLVELAHKVIAARKQIAQLEFEELVRLLTHALPAECRDLLQALSDFFFDVDQFMMMHQASEEGSASVSQRLRILKEHVDHEFWKETLVVRAGILVDIGVKFTLSIQKAIKKIIFLDNEKLLKQTEGLRQEILALSMRVEEALGALKQMVLMQQNPEKVLWCDSRQKSASQHLEFVNADLDLSHKMNEYLFKKFPTVVLCSATLTTNRTFTYKKQRLGLSGQQRLREHIYSSPFDYQKQAVLLLGSELPEPNAPNFTDAAIPYILEAVKASRGHAFVLFTSFSMMEKCYRALEKSLIKHRLHPLKQGVEARHTLLKQFQTEKNAVLFGTDSFWEGVDVVGDLLKCVVIVKLPFRVPSEPILEARAEAIVRQGGNPFYDLTIPTAIMKFKQGFGRLIRSKSDSGCIVCLDSRLKTKRYGTLFLNSLPNCQVEAIESSQKLFENMEAFYRKQYFFRNKAGSR